MMKSKYVLVSMLILLIIAFAMAGNVSADSDRTSKIDEIQKAIDAINDGCE